MTSIVTFNEAEVAEPADFDNIGLFARKGDENIAGGAVGYPAHWSGFTVSKQSSVVLRLSPGRLFKNEMIYADNDLSDLNLQIHLPLVTNDGKWVAILARGVTIDHTAQRLIETDADNEETVQQTVPKVTAREIEYVVQAGIPGPTPLKPSVANTECVVAYVFLKTTGIDSIEPGESWRAKTLFEVEGRVTALELTLIETLQAIATIRTDIADINSRLKNIPRPELMRQIQRDLAQTRRLIALPDEARAYWYDNGLLQDQWDKQHADWLARVREGIRYAYANQSDSQLSVQNPADPAIYLTADMLMPAWTEAPRIIVEPGAGFKNISQLQHTVVTAIQRSIARTSVSYGPTIQVCENAAEWSAIHDLYAGQTFAHDGETFQVTGLLDAEWNNNPQNVIDHAWYGVQQVTVNSWTEYYWDYITTNYGINGSVYAQTFLNSQPMIATSIDLYFTRVGAISGDVYLSICECSRTGAPLFDKVIVHTSVSQADLLSGSVNAPATGGDAASIANQAGTVGGWKKFAFRPTLLEAGKRYAWFTVTTGNHALATVAENKFGQGTLFYATDGQFSAGDPETDFAFRLNAAKFAATRTVVQFDSLTLENGMSEFTLLYPGWKPGATDLVWEIKPDGYTEWTQLAPFPTNPLSGLPALTQLRATFLGTTDLQPCIVMGSKARGYAGRYRSDFRAVSKLINFGLTTTSIVVETTVDNFDPDHNSFANKIIVGSTVYSPAATTMTIDFTKPSRRKYISTFTVPSTTSARVRPEGTTDSAIKIPFIQDIACYAM